MSVQLSRGEAAVSLDEIEALLGLCTPFADFALESNSVAMEAFHKQTGQRGISLPDPVGYST